MHIAKNIVELALSKRDLNYGINTGLGALVSENKVLCHPSSVDSIPTSLGQEDHVSMGSISALNLLKVFENVETVLGIECFTAAQALDFRSPLKSGRGVEMAHKQIRKEIKHASEDHYFKEDLEIIMDVIRRKKFVSTLNSKEYSFSRN